MPDPLLHLLLDQNIPGEVARWLREKRPDWKITSAKEAGLNGQPDEQVFRWAQASQAIVLTYDEDFADARLFPLGSHCGVVRLRVWPTTTEATEAALDRMLTQVPEADLPGSLVIIDREKIRLRRKS
jgi:predicted nuclease of predicted toxin-antitoxin system